MTRKLFPVILLLAFMVALPTSVQAVTVWDFPSLCGEGGELCHHLGGTGNAILFDKNQNEVVQEDVDMCLTLRFNEAGNLFAGSMDIDFWFSDDLTMHFTGSVLGKGNPNMRITFYPTLLDTATQLPIPDEQPIAFGVGFFDTKKMEMQFVLQAPNIGISLNYGALTGNFTLTEENFGIYCPQPPPEPSINLEEVVTGSVLGGSTVTSDVISSGTNQLYLAAISSKPARTVTSVTGLGLTWTLVARQCSARETTMTEVWSAYGTPAASGVVAAVLDVAPQSSVIIVTRYSGANATTQIGSVVSANTEGVSGACGVSGTDNDSWSIPITTTGNNSVVYAAVGLRHTFHTAGTDWVELAEIHEGINSGLAVIDATVATPSLVMPNGTFSEALDWSAVAVEILQ